MSENTKTFNTLPERLQSWIGKTVVIEGSAAYPAQTAGGMLMVMSPARGKLIEVFADGHNVIAITVMEKDDVEPTVFMAKNIRSVTVLQNVPGRGAPRIHSI